MKKHIFILSALLALFSGSNFAPLNAVQDTEKDAKSAPAQSFFLTEVPISTNNNRNVVMVEVAGEALHFVLDTGATRTALFQSEDLEFDHLPKVGSSQIIFPALDEKVTGSVLAPFDIDFGDYSYRPERPLLIHKRPPVGDRLNFAFDGVLGQDFFAAHVVEISPDTQKMKLHSNGKEFPSTFAAKIDLVLKDGAPYIEYSAKMPWEHTSRKKSMMLDTGYPGLMVFWSDKHFLRAAGKKRAEALRASNTGIFTRATFKVGTVRYIHGPIFLAPNVPMQAQERDGIIGSNILNSHHHAFDLTGGKLYLGRRKMRYSRIDGAFYVPNNEEYIFKRFVKPVMGIKHIIENNPDN
jgi:hypothetical protein